MMCGYGWRENQLEHSKYLNIEFGTASVIPTRDPVQNDDKKLGRENMGVKKITCKKSSFLDF